MLYKIKEGRFFFQALHLLPSRPLSSQPPVSLSHRARVTARALSHCHSCYRRPCLRSAPPPAPCAVTAAGGTSHHCCRTEPHQPPPVVCALVHYPQALVQCRFHSRRCPGFLQQSALFINGEPRFSVLCPDPA